MTVRIGTIAALVAAITFAPLAAQTTPESEQEREARLARSGAGLRVGFWNVANLREAENATTSTWPYIEGYFQRGLDRHLAIESSIGLYRRQERIEGTSGPLGTAPSTTTAYIVPLLTSVKFYPFTQPGAALEPHVLAGVGFALGIEDQEGGSGGLLRSPGTVVVTGFGARGGAGLDIRLGDTFGFSAGAGYQWIRFSDPVGGLETYAGPTFTTVLTYRLRF
jgi:hypothetical protein